MDQNKEQKETSNFYSQLTSIKINNNLWFVADEVSDVLELNNTDNLLGTLDKEEHLFTEVYRYGEMQKTHIISESGLYVLIFASAHPTAVKFRKWVTSNVLPMIRFKGYFSQKAY